MASKNTTADIPFYRPVMAIVYCLMMLDIGAIAMLLYRWSVPLTWAIPIAVGVGGATSYRAQFKNLLSPREFRHHRSPFRHLLMAIFILCVNGGSFWAVAHLWLEGYLLIRLLTALVVVWAWGRREGPRLLGDGIDQVKQKLQPGEVDAQGVDRANTREHLG